MDIQNLAGTRLGNYEIEHLLGRGGMGVVYKARQISLDRPVALKILQPTLSSDASFIKRFQREARAVAQLDHSNIIQIFDIAEEAGLHFFSMQYVEGRTLHEVLREQGRLNTDEAVRIITQAAQGIEHAHLNGIIHRDIKPSNIILDNAGNVKVMDFGVARIADDRSKLTQSGTLMGTLDYMSPEQCRGEELGVQTDIYSLGVVLYEMLTGTTPFDAPNEAALIHKIINEEPPEVRALNPGVPAGLSILISRTMAKHQDFRHPTIAEFIRDLQGLVAASSSIAVADRQSRPSIAVLPFVDMSPQKDQEYFCDGVAETLINELTQLSDLKVIARTSAFSFKSQNIDVRDIGRKLNVKTVLEGSVQKAGNRIRITAQLVDTTEGHHIWSEKYDRELHDIFAVQDEITLAIVDKLKPRLLKEKEQKLAKRKTIDLKAYDLYLKGRYFWTKRTEEGMMTAISYFEQATKKDPEYALAYVGLADAYSHLFVYSIWPPRKARPKAKEAALRALKIDNMLGEAHASLAQIKYCFDWDWEDCEKEFKRAVDLNPSYAEAHMWYSALLMCTGRFDEAIMQAQKAVGLDPLSLIINRNLGVLYLVKGRYDQAIEVLQKTIEMEPDYRHAHLYLGMAYMQKSMHEEGIAEFEKEREISAGRDPLAEMGAGVAYALLGRRDEACEMLDNLMERSKEAYVPSAFIARLKLALGETDQGFELLEQAYEERDNLLAFLKVDPLLEMLDLRSDPRYLALLKKMNLEP
jgi:serine/threonine protein kinase/Tfp pilus assembly protein PilF